MSAPASSYALTLSIVFFSPSTELASVLAITKKFLSFLKDLLINVPAYLYKQP